MKRRKANQQSGIALVSALLILLLLSALAAGLVVMTNTETTVETNYRQERMLDYAARAGIEEVRDRLAAVSTATLVSPTCTPASACLAAVPVVPSTANQGILYVLGGPTPASVTPWTAGTIYTDDELCHDGYGLVAVQSSDVRCTTVPAGTGWYAKTTSKAPWNGTAAALPYQWVRVSWKLNGSVQGYPVNSASCPAVGAAGCSTPVCWSSSHGPEVLMTAATCAAMSPPATPVYLLTSLAVNTTTGARKIVQAEVALPPPTIVQHAGFFATSTACPAITLSGGSDQHGTDPTTGSYSSTSSGPPYTIATTGGSIGTNGTVNFGGSGTQVGGSIYAANTNVGGCPAGLNEVGNQIANAANTVIANTSITIPTPPLPNPLPPTTSYSGSQSLVPGNYGNINGNGTWTLAPGTYNINSLQIGGGGNITISPAGAVVINIAGLDSSGSCLTQPLTFGGGATIDNTSGVAANFQINIPGTNKTGASCPSTSVATISGGSSAFAVINAPNTPVTVSGSSTFYGSITASTITDTGGASLYFDTALLSSTTSPVTNYTEIGMREVAY